MCKNRRLKIRWTLLTLLLGGGSGRGLISYSYSFPTPCRRAFVEIEFLYNNSIISILHEEEKLCTAIEKVLSLSLDILKQG